MSDRGPYRRRQRFPRGHFRLPDLPIVGYSTRRDREGTDAIMLFMRNVERDRLRLLDIVCEGRDVWRDRAAKVFGTGLNIGTEQIDEMFWYFTLLACKPAVQRRLLDARGNPDATRAIVREAMPDIEAQREQVRLMAKWGA